MFKLKSLLALFGRKAFRPHNSDYDCDAAIPKEYPKYTPVEVVVEECERPESEKAIRIATFMKRLKDAPPAGSRDEAYDLMDDILSDIEKDVMEDPMRVYDIDEQYDWKFIESDPCHRVDFAAAEKHRTMIFHSGAILITCRGKPILEKPGRAEYNG